MGLPSHSTHLAKHNSALLVDDILPFQPLRQWVLSVPFPLRLLFASNPKAMTGVLGIVYRAISTDLTRKASLKNPIWFRRTKAPTRAELTRLTHTIALRVGRYLERQGLIERDSGNIFLTREALDVSDEDPTNQLLGSSITYRIAVGPQQGRKVFTLQTLPDLETDSPFPCSAGEVAGFSLHAGVATKANERAKLERLCRYITRPAVSTKRLSITHNGRVRYE